MTVIDIRTANSRLLVLMGEMFVREVNKGLLYWILKVVYDHDAGWANYSLIKRIKRINKYDGHIIPCLFQAVVQTAFREIIVE